MRKNVRKTGPCLFVILLILLLASVIFLNKKEYKWVFVYYMPYDNDLNRHGEEIISRLKEGILNSNVAVITQADFRSKDGMKRIILCHPFGRTIRKEFPLKSEDIAEPAELKKYFKWVQKNYKAENYCIVFLNHGGKLNSICLDERPSRFYSEKWLRSDEVGKIIADFNQNVDGKVRLLFLQHCGRASIQNLYNFTDAAQYIIASPITIYPPGGYFTQTLKYVCNQPDLTGIKLARIIMQQDKDYRIHTLIDNNELKNLPEMLTPLLRCFTQNPSLNQPQSCRPIFEFEGEKFYDLKMYLQGLNSANSNIAEKELENFFGWCDNNFI